MYSQAQLRAWFSVAGFEPQTWIPMDNVYRSPTREWVLGKFGKWWTLKLTEDEVSYLAESQDCDDYTLGYVFYARRAKFLTDKDPSALAVGILYFTASAGRHAVAVWVVGDGQVLLVDPQRPTEELVLSEVEKRSCYFVMI